MQDASKIDGNFLLDTKKNLETCIKNMEAVYDDLSIPEAEQASQMLEEINAII